MAGLEATAPGPRRIGIAMLVIGAESLPVSRMLCIGAHSDDIEIGCGATILKLLDAHPDACVDWVVLSAESDRAGEARASAELFLAGVRDKQVAVEGFRERYFPYDPALKEYFDALGRRADPDLVLCPWSGDAHQDHRLVAELAANTFRSHLILEYEIPKFDGDLGRPSVYVHARRELADRKVELLSRAFRSQHDKPWFDAETFLGLMRLRGVESRAPDGYAEAFHCRKLVLA